MTTFAGTGLQTITTRNSAGVPVAATFIIPAYQYPTVGLWPTLYADAPNGYPGYVIANPASGPGTTVDSDYTTAIANARSAGWRVLGYVDTNVGGIASATVETNITRWSTLYGVHDIFFDRASALSTEVAYYTTLTAFVHAAHGGSLSILNTGTVPNSGYFATAVCDGLIVFEDTYATFQSTPPPNYTGSPVMIGHIVQNVPIINAVSQIAASAALGATLQYVTDESDGNYDVLPGYFTNENVLLDAPNPDLATAPGTVSVTATAVGTWRSMGALTVAVTASAVGTPAVSGLAECDTTVTALAVGALSLPASGSQTITSYNDAGIPLDATYIIPAYQYPTVGMWGASFGSPSGGRGYVIANVNSGPGTVVDSDYTTAIAAAIAAGWTVLGYVPTNYGATATGTVEAMVTKWSTLYGIHSIFFDEGSTLSTKVAYYTTLTAFVHAAHAGSKTILNPGTTPDPGYISPTVCDGICVFEDIYANFLLYPPPSYTNAGILICHIVQATPLANATTQMLASVALGANLIYVTDESDYAYDVLPTYFAGENVLLANRATGAGSFTATTVTATAAGVVAPSASSSAVFVATAAGLVPGTGNGYGIVSFTSIANGLTAIPPPPPPGPLPLAIKTPTTNPITYLLFDVMTGDMLAELPFTGVTWSQRLNTPGTFSASLNFLDPKVRKLFPGQIIQPGRTALFIDYAGHLLAGFLIWTVNFQRSSADAVPIQGKEFWSYFASRVQAADYTATWAAGGDPMAIAAQVISDALATTDPVTSLPDSAFGSTTGFPLAINQNNGSPTPGGTGPTGDWVVETYPLSSIATVDSIVTSLTAMGYGVGFDYAIDVAYSTSGVPTLKLNMAYPRRGRLANVDSITIVTTATHDYSYPQDATSQGSTIHGTGSGSAIALTQYVPGPITPTSEGWPRLEQVVSYTNILSADVLAAVVDEDLTMQAYPITVPTLIMPLFSDPDPTAYALGDDVRWIIEPDERFPDGNDSDWRIVGLDYAITEEGVSTVTLTFNLPPSATISAPPT